MSAVNDEKIRGLEAFVAAVIRPEIDSGSVALAARAHVTRLPISIAEARRRAFREVKPGWFWGPSGATCWFQLSGRVPEEFHGDELVLRFSGGHRTLLWDRTSPRAAFDSESRTVQVFGEGNEAAVAGEAIEFWVETVCPAEEVRAGGSASETPGRFDGAELCRIHPEVKRLESSFAMACELARELEPGNRRRIGIEAALDRSREIVRREGLPRGAAAALEPILASLAVTASGSEPFVHAVGRVTAGRRGEAPKSEHQRRLVSDFVQVLALAETAKDWSWCSSEAAPWVWMEEDSPPLFERLRAAVLEGRIDPRGACFVEPEMNLASGESLVRQILHGRSFWKRHLGEAAQSTWLDLQEGAGLPPSLPQILRQCGLEFLVASRPQGGERRALPGPSFLWQGIDGSEVLVHLTTERGEGRPLAPGRLRRVAAALRPVPHVFPGRWLEPVGGGEEGGVSPGDLRLAEQAKDCDGLPRLRLGTLEAFFVALREDRDLCKRRGGDFPRVRGELGLDVQRGSFTTHGRLKGSNRRTERALFAAELLNYAAPEAPRSPAALRARFDEVWRAALSTQAVGVLSGSSSAEVNAEVKASQERVAGDLKELQALGLKSWATAVDTRGLEDPLLIFNPAGGEPRRGVIDAPDALHGGAPLWVEGLPAHGIAAVDVSRNIDRASPEPARASGTRLENEFLEVEIDAVGRIARMIHRPTGREMGGRLAASNGTPTERAPLNQLTLSMDHPAGEEARWLDAEVDATAEALADPAESIRVRENGPLRARIEVSRSLGKHSRIVQTYTLAAGSPRLDVETLVDWHEERRLLRATFPLDVTSPRATCDLPFGVVERPAHEGLGSQQESAEDCAQRFVVVSEAGFGVALLNDSKYGHSWREGALRLSLLRSPVGADLAVDRGEHRFTYALMPFAGDWRTAGVLHETEKLNAPLQLLRAPAGSSPSPTSERTWAPFEIEVPKGSSCTPVIDAFKEAEDGGAVCLRLHEHGGGRGEVIVHWRLDVDTVETVNLIEEPRSCDGFVHVGRMTRLTLTPFEISTLRVCLRR